MEALCIPWSLMRLSTFYICIGCSDIRYTYWTSYAMAILLSCPFLLCWLFITERCVCVCRKREVLYVLDRSSSLIVGIANIFSHCIEIQDKYQTIERERSWKIFDMQSSRPHDMKETALRKGFLPSLCLKRIFVATWGEPPVKHWIMLGHKNKFPIE